MRRWTLVTVYGYLVLELVWRSRSKLKNKHFWNMNIFLRHIENKNVGLSLSSNIDFSYPNIDMAKHYFSNIEKSISLKYDKTDL